MPDPTEIAVNPIHLDTLPEAFTPDGLQARTADLLQQLGVNKLSELVSVLQPISGAVQTAPKGVIQDPAGAAVGAGKNPMDTTAEGASRAIYAQFPDLKPIPQIQPRSAIFNSSTGPGRRVLHTFSPTLTGTPHSSEDRRKAIENLANAYANALEASRDRAADLGSDGKLLNLIPVSAGIFADQFRVHAYQHLHPSYTICAIALALNWWRASNPVPPSLTIYFYKKPVHDDARDVMNQLTGATHPEPTPTIR